MPLLDIEFNVKSRPFHGIYLFAVDCKVKFSLILFYGISTIVGYSMSNPLILDIYVIYKQKLTKLNGSNYCYVLLTIQLNISHLLTQLNDQTVLF